MFLASCLLNQYQPVTTRPYVKVKTPVDAITNQPTTQTKINISPVIIHCFFITWLVQVNHYLFDFLRFCILQMVRTCYTQLPKWVQIPTMLQSSIVRSQRCNIWLRSLGVRWNNFSITVTQGSCGFLSSWWQKRTHRHHFATNIR